jgi:Flp pilus assembly protein TadG
MRRHDHRASRQGGLAAVELALLLPVFLFIVTATAEAGRALYEYNALTKGVRDAAQYLARYGVIDGTGVLAPTTAEEAAARNLAVFGTPGGGSTPLLPGLSTGDIALSYQALAPSATANQVTVVATYTYLPLFGYIPGFGLGDDFTPNTQFTATMVMLAVGGGS